MNLFLFHKSELIDEQGTLRVFLSSEDSRFTHITKILHLDKGYELDVGVIGGLAGTGIISEISKNGLFLQLNLENVPPHPRSVSMIIGAVRPIVAKRLLKDMCTLGVNEIHFTATELSEKSYLRSTLWNSENYKSYLVSGAEQARSTYLPKVNLHASLQDCLQMTTPKGDLICLDNSVQSPELSAFSPKNTSVCLAVGPERGWSENEIHQLRIVGFAIYNLGDRVLRTETACTAGLSIVSAKLGFM